MDTFRRLVADVGPSEAARRLGVSQGMVSNVLRGRKRFGWETACRIEKRMRRTKYPIKRAELRDDIFG